MLTLYKTGFRAEIYHPKISCDKIIISRLRITFAPRRHWVPMVLELNVKDKKALYIFFLNGGG